MNPRQLRELISFVLHCFRKYSLESVDLLMVTAAQESQCGKYIRQLGGGPALGIFQMEPATLDDIWKNYLGFREKSKAQVKLFLTPQSMEANLSGNLLFQIVIARVHYMRVQAPIPKREEFSDSVGDPDKNYIMALAQYWKKYWNTEKGAGTAVEAFENYHKFCAQG